MVVLSCDDIYVPVGYSATLENVGENDSLHSLPASFPTPPINSSHSSTWPNDHRRRSTSLIGQHVSDVGQHVGNTDGVMLANM